MHREHKHRDQISLIAIGSHCYHLLCVWKVTPIVRACLLTGPLTVTEVILASDEAASAAIRMERTRKNMMKKEGLSQCSVLSGQYNVAQSSIARHL